MNIFGFSAGAEFTLGDASTITPELPVHGTHGLINFRGRADRQEMLSVDLTPKRDLTGKRRQLF